MPTEQKPNTPKKPLNNYAKYSAMGFQMVTIILLGTWGGIKLDEFLGFSKTPVLTIICALLSVVLAMYFVVKDFFKK